MRSIYIINPITIREVEELTLRDFEPFASSDTQLHVVSMHKGPPGSIECRYDEAMAVPYILQRVKEIEDKADAIIINCFLDSGVDAAREITDVPIIGPGISTMAIAQLLGHNFSVVTVLSRLAPIIEELATKLGTHKLVSVRSVDIPALEIKDNPKTLEKLTEEARKAIEKDGAHVIVLGCTCMVGLAEQVKLGLAKQSYEVSVLDSAMVSVKIAESLIDMKISYSRLTYPQPPEKARVRDY